MKLTAPRWFLVGALLSLGRVAGAQAPAATDAAPETPPAERPPVDTRPTEAPPATAADLLSTAHAAVDGGRTEDARALYQRVVSEHPQSPQAAEAARALKLMGPATAPQPALRSDDPPGSIGRDKIVMRQEPYSLVTSERLRLTTWEKLDFGVTSFLYGLTVGLAYWQGLPDEDSSPYGTEARSPAIPMVVGALSYTAGAVAFLSLAKPDRGDLPLALAITSYVPTTALLVVDATSSEGNERSPALAFAISATLALPAAVLATRSLDLDPGDTQLVRDAGFWGLVLGFSGTLGFGTRTRTYKTGDQVYAQEYEVEEDPSQRTVALAGLVGLYGGLAAGAVAAASSDVSLERVRVTTWGGYGGALVGALIGGGNGDGDHRIFSGLAVGAAAGLALTFVLTSGLDGIPPGTPFLGRASRTRLQPALVSAVDVRGRAVPGFGVALAAR